MKTIFQKKYIQFVLLVLGVFVSIFISSKVFFRIDLTTEKRYTLSDETIKIVESLNDKVVVKVYLTGDLPLGFKKLSNSIRETMDELKVHANNNLQYEFVSPSESSDIKVNEKLYAEISQKGVLPTNVQIRDKNGNFSEKLLFPGAIVTYKNVEIPIRFLKNNSNLSADENLNNSMQSVEFELMKAIYALSKSASQKIAFLEGHGELNELETSDITRELSTFFQVDRGTIGKNQNVLNAYKAIIIARPTQQFTEIDKLAIDQYIMKGGKVVWILNKVHVNIDSLTTGYTFGFPLDLNIDDLLFTYGVRINPTIVKDIQCNTIPVNTALAGNSPRWTPVPWLYYPIISPLVEHSITRNLNLVLLRYASQIDTVGLDSNVHKTPLLKTSMYTSVVKTPIQINLSEVKKTPSRNEFNQSNKTVAILLEGTFKSAFRNRIVENASISEIKHESIPNKMIVIADGEIIANDVRITPKGSMVSPLGYDKYTRQTFGNKEFISNCVNYLADESGLLTLRSKQFKLRVLDKQRVREERLKWQLINLALPVIIILFFGLFYHYYRIRRYVKK